MRRVGLGLGLAVLAALGAVAAVVVTRAPSARAGGSTSTGTATTATTTTPQVIAPGVRIGGVRVGGMTADEAAAAVEEVFDRPLEILVARHRLVVTAQHLGTRARIGAAVARALSAPEGAKVRLVVEIRRAKIRTYVAAIANRFDREPVDATLTLRRLRPWITKERSGRALRRRWAYGGIVDALAANRRSAVRLSMRALPPHVTRAGYGPVIVIRRGSNALYLYNGMRFWRSFGVATGQSQYPTPLGRWTIVVKWRNPWW